MTTTTTEQTLRELLTVMWLDGHIELADGPDDIADVVNVGEAAISAALDAKPNNWTLRLIYADWLEVLGNPCCESQRWMVANEKKPWRVPSHSTVQIWDWWWETSLESESCDLVASVFNALEGQPPEHYEHSCRTYPTRTAAELDLHNALVKAGEITCEEVEA